MRDGQPVLMRLPELKFIDDQAGKPVGINQKIGRLDKGLGVVLAKGWRVVDMKQD